MGYVSPVTFVLKERKKLRLKKKDKRTKMVELVGGESVINGAYSV